MSISDDERHVAIVWYRRGTVGWEEAASARGGTALEIDDPFPLHLRPDDLLF